MDEKSERKNIWERSVGVRLKEITKKNGETFQAFEFVRFYTEPDSDESKYSSLFTERNLPALESLLKKLKDHFSSTENSEPADSFQVLGKIETKKIPAEKAIAG